MGKVTCGECKKSCKGQAVRLQDKYFHVKCFKCKECNKQLAAGGFYSKDNSFYCADDYQRLFGTKCAGCGKFVEGEVITALGNTYHQECFRCTKCRNHFGAGDKVTYNGQEYLCNKCLEKLELASSPRPASPKTGSVPPGSPNGHAPQQLQANMAPNLSSTPSRPVVDGHLGSPMSDDSNTYDKKYDHSGSAYETDEEELSGYLQSPHDHIAKLVVLLDSDAEQSGSQSEGEGASNQKGRLSPIQQIMQYRTPSPVNSTISRSSQKSRESSGSYEPKYDVNYGRFYKTSFLKVTPQTGFKKGPSLNPADPPKSPHFHRPENFSYSQVRRDFVRPLKKETSSAPQQQSSQPPPPPQSWKKSSKQTYGMMSALGDTNTLMAKRKMESIVPMDNREAIKLSRFPDAHRPDVPRPPPIERDDWPAPPAPAAAYPEMLYEGHYRSKSEENLEEKKEEKIDPKIQKEIEELSKIMDSGVGKVILKDLEKKKHGSPILDPRSASRVPSANREPHYKTRYESAAFASPSRDLDYRPRLHSMDDEIISNIKYRNTTLPISNFPVDRSHHHYEVAKPHVVKSSTPVPKPGYGLGTKSATLPASTRNGGYNFDDEHRRSNSSMDGDRRSFHSQGDMDEYDPETGLRRCRTRSSGRNFASNFHNYMMFRRSMPSMLKTDEPPRIYPYEQLLVTNYELPPGVERNTIEMHLSQEEFETIFHMRRADFYRMAEWRRNDLKKRVGLF